MKKDFVQLVKDMRKELHPAFATLGCDDSPCDPTLQDIEDKQDQMIKDAGYTSEEFGATLSQYSYDFSSDNPDEWKVWLSSDNQVVIVQDDK